MQEIGEMLLRGRKVTDAYFHKGAKWSLPEQLLKIYEEVGELQRAENHLEVLEEGSDVFYAVLTYWHMLGMDDYAIKESLESTMKKIEKRSQEWIKHE